ncbi:hypothetical protein J2W63_004212, partial [Klebsiella sp. 1400]|nr:hypothetical protein [Klebsiella sp. 1400]
MRLSGLPGGVQQAKKKPVLAYELFFEDGGEGGRFLAGSSSVQLAVASCRTPVGASPPPGRCYMRKKSPYLRTSSSSKMAVRGGRFLAGSSSVQLAVASCRTPVGASPPPRQVLYAKKKPVLAYELFFEDGGEGGRFLAGSSSVQLAVASCRTPVGASPPPGRCYMRKKSPYLRTSSSS